MSRFFNNRQIELLAPTGTFKDFEEIITSSADAVYFGGKKFNMRMHRKDYNLTDEEIQNAVSIAHSMGKKAYVTFNNMMSDEELRDSEDYLLFLEGVKPDGFIVQDLGAVRKIKELCPSVPIHLSVMANVHNRQMVDKAMELGVTRVVTSREMPLETISRLSENTTMEFEYFIHGDMCAVHGAQCLYSGALFGKSSNRGLCMKPCRWKYKYNSSDEEFCYPLAVKDMSLFRHLPELIQSGVCSFKIEGRMRDSSYLVELINIYGEAIDSYINDPTGYHIDEVKSSQLYEKRVRNLSTAYAFKKPGSINVDIDGKREPRIFSKPVEEFEITGERIESIKSQSKVININSKSLLLSVKVNNLSAFKKAADSGADIIYIPGEVFRKDAPFTLEEFSEAAHYANGKKVYFTLPRMMYSRQFNEYSILVNKLKSLGVTGLLASNLGSVKEYAGTGFDMAGDFGLNIYNCEAAAFYKDQGLGRITASIESPFRVLKSMLENKTTDMEVIVQGAPAMMYMEHCIYSSRYGLTSSDWCSDFCSHEPISLIDELGNSHPVMSDQYCKNHIITTKDICLIPLLKELNSLGADVVRIEGQHYSPDTLGKIVSIYRKAIDNSNKETNWIETVSEIRNTSGRGQSLQALNFD